jgi:ABC-type spermidine/putrescine transport system permease subunit I
MSSTFKGFSPAIPALVLLGVFFLYPVVRMLGFAVEGGTMDWFAKALGERLYLQVFWNTFQIAVFVTILCLLLAYPLGFMLATTTPGWATLGFIFVLLPLWTSVLVRTYAWMVLLGRNGVFNRWLIGAGIIDDPLPLLHNLTGVLIGMVHVLLPYMVLPVYGCCCPTWCCRSTVQSDASIRRSSPRPRAWAPRPGTFSGAFTCR